MSLECFDYSQSAWWCFALHPALAPCFASFQDTAEIGGWGKHLYWFGRYLLACFATRAERAASKLIDRPKGAALPELFGLRR